jgi:hypothetical protein
VEWYLDRPVPKLCPVIPTFNQDGRQAKNRKRWAEIKKKCSLKLLNQSQPNFAEFPIGFYVKLSSVVGAIMVEGPNPTDTFLEENHPMTISSKFSS